VNAYNSSNYGSWEKISILTSQMLKLRKEVMITYSKRTKTGLFIIPQCSMSISSLHPSTSIFSESSIMKTRPCSFALFNLCSNGANIRGFTQVSHTPPFSKSMWSIYWFVALAAFLTLASFLCLAFSCNIPKIQFASSDG
jgi:hypothetical protein